MEALAVPDATLCIVGREREQEILRQQFVAVSASHGSLVFIAGAAGAGKTTLVSAFTRGAAGDGALVLTGRCYETLQPPPYSLWLDLFEYYPVTAQPASPAPFTTPSMLGSITNPAALTGQMREWLIALSAQQPLVLVLEDLHWADAASLHLLRTLARALAHLPVLMLATYREGERGQGHPLIPLLPRLVRETDATCLTLHPLSVANLYALVATRYRLPETKTVRLATYLYDRATGNAFFSVELLRALEEHQVLRRGEGGWTVSDLLTVPVPSLLRQMIEERVNDLGSEGRTLLETASVIGQDVPLKLWARVSGWEEREVLTLAERAVAASLLHLAANGSSVHFVHALLRETLYTSIAFTRRKQIHADIATALATEPNADPGIIAAHFQSAGDARAVEWLLRAAERAERAYAYVSAMGYLEVVLTLLEAQQGTEVRRAELLLRIVGLGRFSPWTVPRVREALRLATEFGDTALIAVAQLRLSFAALPLVDSSAGYAMQGQALRAFEALPAETRASLTRVDAVAASLPKTHDLAARLPAIVGQFAAMFRMLEVSPDEPYAYRPTTDGTAFGAIGTAFASLGRLQEARAAYADSAAWFLALEQHATIGAHFEWRLNEFSLIFESDDPPHLTALAAMSEREYRRDAAVPDTFPVGIAHAGLLALHGDWDEAVALIGEMRDKIGMCGWWGMYLPVLGQVAHARGNQWGVEAVVREVFPTGPDTAPGGLYLQNALRIQRLAATLALDAGNTDDTRRWLEAHDRWLIWSGAVLGRADGCLAWARYHRATGDQARAVTDAQRALDLADAPRQPLALLAAHRLCGELATDAREFRDARTHLDTALALADACAAPYERALTLIALATWHRTAGESEANTDAALAEAQTICTRLGARPALHRIAVLAGTPRAHSATPDTALDVGLTKREYEVLVLLAAGGTNTTVADALSLSLRTVERHIANLYAKTSTHTRADVLIFAARHGLGHTLTP